MQFCIKHDKYGLETELEPIFKGAGLIKNGKGVSLSVMLSDAELVLIISMFRSNFSDR